MRSISDTISRFSSHRGRHVAAFETESGHLEELTDFGSNPGALKAWAHVPTAFASGAALVVVLHGCTQNAADFDRGTGWSQLADAHGFAVLLPEQTRANNINLCFNWYDPADSRRGAGEPLSIIQMIETMITRYGIDPARVYVTGLSAGGAMTSVMLATYPDVFAGGAIVAGLPFGSASGIPQAFDRMRGHGGPSPAALATSVREASPRTTDWPSVAVWHGTRDAIVDVSNAGAIVEQWRQVHGASSHPQDQDRVEGHDHRAWRDATGRVVLEEYLITGMGHGTPLATSGADACGVAGPYMLDVGFSSTRRIAAAWGLAQEAPRSASQTVPRRDVIDAHPAPTSSAPTPEMLLPATNVGRVIEDALRAAGLMR